MTNAIRLNHLTKEILISKSFSKVAMNPLSTEYRDLSEVMEKHPNYTVSMRVIRQNTHKETYAGLTYDYMREYIILHSSPEEKLAEIAEFNEMLLISRCHAKALRYPTIKKWFLTKYPEVAEFGVEEAYKTLRVS